MVRFEKDGTKEYFNVAVRDQYKDYIWYVFRINHYLDHSAMKYMASMMKRLGKWRIFLTAFLRRERVNA